ncbi:MAG: DUF2333 family protein [Syntrophobacteria bacterium]
MAQRRGLSRLGKTWRRWLRRLPRIVLCNLGIVLIVSLVIAGCERKAEPPPAEPSGELPAESQEKPTQGATGPPGEAKVAPKRAPALPVPQEVTERSPEIPGLAFTEKFIALLDHELNGRFLGWRPNDLVLGRFTDNVDEFQLGALEAIRYTAIKLKETLTRFGDADAYDPHLIKAVNLLMNRADQFWFPSTESQYQSALEELKAFLINLEKGKSRFYYRTDNLLSLVTSYKDLLGNCYENLVKEFETDGSRVSFFQADNYFCYAQGVAYVIDEMLKAARVGFVEQLRTIDAVALMDKTIQDLERAVDCSPWVITNSGDGSILANHRYHLGASVSSALYNMSTMLRY